MNRLTIRQHHNSQEPDFFDLNGRSPGFRLRLFQLDRLHADQGDSFVDKS